MYSFGCLGERGFVDKSICVDYNVYIISIQMVRDEVRIANERKAAKFMVDYNATFEDTEDKWRCIVLRSIWIINGWNGYVDDCSEYKLCND